MTSIYRLKFKKVRETTDLTKYETAIIEAIYEIIDRSIGVRVEPIYFEIEADISKGTARKIGKKISYRSPEIRSLRKIYTSKDGKKVSRQIFERVK